MKKLLFLIGLLFIVFTIKAQTWEAYNASNSNLSNPTQYPILRDVDDSGNAWFGYTGAGGYGLIKYDVSSDIFNIYNTSNSGIPSHYIRDVEVDNSGNIWFSYYTAGSYYNDFLCKFDGNTTYETIDPSNSNLPNAYIRDVFSTSSGDIWLATMFEGILEYLGGNTFDIYNTGNSPLPSDTIYNIKEDTSGNLWIGTNNGLVKFDGNSNWDIFNTSNSILPSNEIQHLTIDINNNIWVWIDYNGLYKCDGISWQHFFNYPTSNEKSLALTSDDNGNIWMGRDYHGVVKFDGSNWTVYNETNANIETDSLYNVLYGAGHIWANSGGGLFKYTDNTTDKNDNTISTISVYPNPAKNFIHISGINENYEATIFDPAGKAVKSCKIDNNKININDISQGIYLIKFRNQKTQKIITKKLIKN